MCVCLCGFMCTTCVEALPESEECQVPRNWHLTWVLETKPRSSGETASDLNRWVIFPAPKITFKETEIMLWVTENIVACVSPVWVMLILDGSTCFWSPVVQCDSVCCVFLSGPWVWMVSHASQQATIPNYCHLTLGSVLTTQGQVKVHRAFTRDQSNEPEKLSSSEDCALESWLPGSF